MKTLVCEKKRMGDGMVAVERKIAAGNIERLLNDNTVQKLLKQESAYRRKLATSRNVV
jgi:hypothetical protein